MVAPHPGQAYADLGPADALRLFFEDVAALPVIDGKHGYLPLTRRIHRAEALAALDGTTPGQKLAALRKALRPFRADLARANGRGPALDLARLDGEIEAFLDDPDQTAPPALQVLARQVDQDDEASDRLWRNFYWLALLPPGSRQDDGVIDDVTIEAAAAHFAHARAEGRSARTQLLEGTLRYVVNIAADYANRGLPYLDLVQEGFFGLARATSGFDERKGHFQQYAATWIRQRIDRAIADRTALIRMPVHLREKVTQAEKAAEIVARTEKQETDCQDERQAKQRQQLAIATAAHYSLERARLPLSDEVGEPLTFADILTALDDVEGGVEAYNFGRFLRDYLESSSSALSTRERDVLYRRFGFDGEEMTLEEIGRADGVTRERIRQIEAKAIKKLKNRLPSGKVKQRLLPPQRQTFLPPPSSAGLDCLRDADRIAPPVDDLARVQRLIQVHVRRGRRTRWAMGRIGRSELLREVLHELGRPVHYSVIHERAMALVPEGKQFTKRETYNRLFYDAGLFRFHGNAVFGLVEWGDGAVEVDGELVFRHCPAPLLPPGAPPAAFFDSLELGRRLLAERPLTAADFWRAMRAWAGDEADARPQEAFNAWYAAGLLGPVRYETEAARWLTLSAPANASLAELRAHALATAARRVERLPELLLALDSVGRPTTEALAWLLYGRTGEGHEVAARLRLLVGLGGARAVGDEWRLTDAGRAALAALPAADLPDEPPPPDEELLELIDLDVYALEFDD